MIAFFGGGDRRPWVGRPPSSLGSLTLSVVLPTALLAPLKVSSSATGASLTAVTVTSRDCVLLWLPGFGPSWAWKVTVRVAVLGFSLLLRYVTARSALW